MELILQPVYSVSSLGAPVLSLFSSLLSAFFVLIFLSFHVALPLPALLCMVPVAVVGELGLSGRILADHLGDGALLPVTVVAPSDPGCVLPVAPVLSCQRVSHALAPVRHSDLPSRGALGHL